MKEKIEKLMVSIKSAQEANVELSDKAGDKIMSAVYLAKALEQNAFYQYLKKILESENK